MKLKCYFLAIFLSITLVLTLNSCLQKKNKFVFNIKTPKIALVLAGPINDSAWNSAAYNGLKRFKSDYPYVKTTTIEKVTIGEAKAVFHALARKKFDLIIAHGYELGEVVKNIAKKYPHIFFCVIGGEVAKKPNLCSFQFKDEQYGYLIGSVAGFNTSTNKVGIVVGKKTPSIERTILGMRKGVRAANPKADLVVSYINSWNDINKGKEAAQAQINTGVDVITHLADISGIGVIKAAEDADISAIGAIQDQHEIAPSTIITSGIQDASQLVYLTSELYLTQELEPLIYKFGLKHQVIDLTPSLGNIDPTTENRIEAIKMQLTELEIAQEEAKEKLKTN